MASVYRKKGGSTWYVSVKNALGEHESHATKAQTKTEAKALAIEMELQAERQRLGLEVRDSAMTFGELAAAWLKDHGSRLRSHKDEEGRINLHLLPTLGSLRLRQVTPHKLDQLWTTKLETHSAQTVVHLRGLVQRMYEKAKRWKLWTGDNPATLSEAPKVVRKPVQFASVAEVEAVLKAATGEFRVLVAAAVFTGIREGELLALTRERVDLERGHILVVKTEGQETTKGGKWRPVPVPEALKVILKAHLKGLVGERLFPEHARYKGGGVRTVIMRELDKTLIAAGLVVRWDHICRRKSCRKVEEHPDGTQRKCSACGYALWPRPLPKELTFHQLRHSYISHLLMGGADPFAVQRIAGHASLEITLGTYGHATTGYLGEQAKKLPDFLPGSYPEDPSPFEGAQDAEPTTGNDGGNAGRPWRDSNPRYRLESSAPVQPPRTPRDTTATSPSYTGVSEGGKGVARTPGNTSAQPVSYPAPTRVEPALTVAEVARWLAVSTATVYAMCKEGRLPHRRLPRGGIRFDRATVEAWLQEQEVRGELRARAVTSERRLRVERQPSGFPFACLG